MATAELVSKLADLQSAGKLATTIGIEVEHPIAAGLVNQSQTHFHAIRDRIPTLLPSEAIDLATYSLPTRYRRIADAEACIPPNICPTPITAILPS